MNDRHGRKVIRFWVRGGPYKHSLWDLCAVSVDENGMECDGGMVRQFDTKREANAAKKLLNGGLR